MKTIRVIDGQTSFDIATQYYGSIEGFFWLVDDNPEVFTSLDVLLAAGTTLKIRETVINKELVDYFSVKGVTPMNPVTNTGGFTSGFSDGFDIGFGSLVGGGFDEGFSNGFYIHD